MAIRVAINGFGRIGRLVLRSIVETGRRDIEVVAVNDLGPVATNAHLLRYDSVHGRFPASVTVDGDIMTAAGHKIKVTAIKDPDPVAAQGTGCGHRAGMHGHLLGASQGGAASGSRRQARAGLGPVGRRRPHGRLWRQRPQADQRTFRRFQRLVHDQLSRPGRQGAERSARHREGDHDHDPLLHQRSADARPAAQGSLSRAALLRCR